MLQGSGAAAVRLLGRGTRGRPHLRAGARPQLQVRRRGRARVLRLGGRPRVGSGVPLALHRLDETEQRGIGHGEGLIEASVSTWDVGGGVPLALHRLGEAGMGLRNIAWAGKGALDHGRGLRNQNKHLGRERRSPPRPPSPGQAKGATGGWGRRNRQAPWAARGGKELSLRPGGRGGNNPL